MVSSAFARMSSSLIGIAVTKGLLTVKDEVRKWVPEPVAGISAGATLEHVLTHRKLELELWQILLAYGPASGWVADTVETFRYARGHPVVAALLGSKLGFGLGTGCVGMLALLATGPFDSGDGGTGVAIAL